MLRQTSLAIAFAMTLGASRALAMQPLQDATPTPPQPAGGHSRTAFIGGHDLDRDGSVSRAEYDSIRQQRFETADADADRLLSETEYVAEYEARLKSQYGERAVDEAFAASLRQAVVRFYAIDRDRDSRISVGENHAVAQRTWDGQDTDGDGVVTPDDPAPSPRSDAGA